MEARADLSPLSLLPTLSSAIDCRFLSGFCWFTGPEVLGLPGGGGEIGKGREGGEHRRERRWSRRERR